jgi:hypothetical protein
LRALARALNALSLSQDQADDIEAGLTPPRLAQAERIPARDAEPRPVVLVGEGEDRDRIARAQASELGREGRAALDIDRAERHGHQRIPALARRGAEGPGSASALRGTSASSGSYWTGTVI